MKRTAYLLVVFALVAVGCRPSADTPPANPLDQLPEGATEAAGVILPEDLLRDVTTLASDDMEGRGPGSAGDLRARAYLTAQLENLGWAPAFADGSWEQPLEIVGVTSSMPEGWSFEGPKGGRETFHFRDDYMGGSGDQQPSACIEDAEIVFVGYGIEAPEESWNDFKDEDLNGKILLMLNGDPHWEEGLFAGERKLYYGRWTYKFESAGRQGAAGAIIIHTTPSAGYGWNVVQTGWTGEQFQLPAGDEPRASLSAWLTEEGARRLVALSGHDLDQLVEAARSRDFRPVPLGTTTSISWSVALRTTETANVGGILRGSDPELADEVVVLSAHHDHFGIAKPDETGDAIYNGALDNGVAMAQALASARAFTALPQAPPRSILVLFVAAEEQGRLGSEYFALSGAYHPGLMAANINFELGNVWGLTHDVTIFGKGKSELDDLLLPLAASQERVLVGETDVRAGWFYRSDQFSFARVGVPAIWFKSGGDFIGRPAGWGEQQYADWIANRYHRPSDEVEPSWNMEGLAQDAQLAFLLAATVANRDEMPKWVPGDEFEDERLAALAQVAHRGQ